MTLPVNDLKTALREQVRLRRRALDEEERASAGRELAVRLGEIPEIAALVSAPSSGCVTAYASFGTEPRTDAMRSLLAIAGVTVLLPVIRPDGGLDWALDGDAMSTDGVSAGIPEPTSDVVAHDLAGLVAAGCRVILAPALAVDLHGNRLGKAGGYYDRLLADMDAITPERRPHVVAVVLDDDVLESVPAHEHDRPVDAVLTPSAYRVLGSRSGGGSQGGA